MASRVDLHQFVYDWKKLLEKPEDLFFSMSMGNISEYFLEFNNRTGKIKQNFQKELLNKLQDTIMKKYVESRLIAFCSPSLISKLSQPLSYPVSIKQVKKYCREIQKVYRKKKFLEGTRRLINNTIGNSNNYDARLALIFLMRSLLTRHTIKYLEKLPEKIFTKEFFALTINEVVKQAGTDNQLSKKILELVTTLLKDVLNEVNKINDMKNFESSLHCGNAYWEREVYFFIQDARNILQNNKHLAKILNMKGCQSAPSILKLLGNKSLSQSIDRMLLGCIDKICNYVAIRCSKLDEYTTYLSNVSNHSFCAMMSDLIKNVAYRGYNISEYEKFNYSIAEAMFWTLNKIICQYISTKVKKIVFRKYRYAIRILIAQHIFNEISRGEFPKYDCKAEDVLTDKFSFNRLLAEYMKSLAKNSCNDILTIIKEIKTKSFVNKIKDEFKQNFFDRLYTELGNRSIHVVPYDLKKNTARKLITALFQELCKTEQSFRVLCMIGGDMDCQGKRIKIGEVTFYDPRIWEFGEGASFDLFYESAMTLGEKLKTKIDKPYEIFFEKEKRLELRRNSARAFVDVIAADPHMAKEQALVLVRKAVDTLVFASSAGGERGFKPQIPNEFFILYKDKQHASHPSSMHPLVSDTFELTEDYDKITSFYNRIMSDSKKQFDERILRALSWYHIGHWELMPYSKFLSHWIALEQLIEKRREKRQIDALVKYVPKITISWRKIDVAVIMMQYLRGITSGIHKNEKLKKYLRNNSKLRNWERNDGVILENIDLLINKTSGEMRSGLCNFKRYLDEIGSIYIRNQIRALRRLQKFKINLLYSKRNSLVHEGLTYSPELDIMSGVLEKLLISTLIPILEFRDRKSLRQIIYEVSRPYHIKKES